MITAEIAARAQTPLHRAVVRRCLSRQRKGYNTRGQLVSRPHCYADPMCCSCYAKHEAVLRRRVEREG